MEFKDKNGILGNLSTRGIVTIELGCGNNKKFKDSIGIDILDADAVDIIADINQGLTFIDDNSVDVVYSSHFLEHVNDFEFVMKEIHRILKVGGICKGQVPHFSNPYYYSDYTHKNFFGLYTFSYLSRNQFYKRGVPKYNTSFTFEIKRIKLIFWSHYLFLNIIRKVLMTIFNISKSTQEIYEASFTGTFPTYEIYFELEK
jgi:SAM-dependent methyltransferase